MLLPADSCACFSPSYLLSAVGYRCMFCSGCYQPRCGFGCVTL
uniref:Uncharacterized protein n=1 Tax=Arundo donax TaxID=35708 RepID=A0A0A9FGA2_ARUDO